ncbi:bifunctional RNase H/acid phosphatase [Streptomyces antimycoticus]|uniref:bifunctional RNase H/acid phosphatase n=1 Tax=Streptomyces antimycoticus TaxID=68175 RepID=UPI0025705F4B|nr:bifunctional RNase H/acid phosphatase [Streptomyces antimycoticus]WJD99966.1 bifunctional RNase H/acid phosphatase [Streptomyces antimycoticus]WTB08249.1 bifunctional RNase H/acid phosphatase [Streptomyces antimycoticus]
MARRFVVEADGGSRGNPGPAGYGAVVLDAETGEPLAEVAEYIGTATNNVAEYKGLIAGLRAAHALDPEAEVRVRMDSKLVIEQMSGRWKIKHPDMRPLAAEAKAIMPPGQLTYEWIPREKNKHADRLANEAMDAGKRGEQWQPKVPPGGTPAAGAPEAAAPADDALAEPAATGAPAVGWGAADLGTPATFVLLRHGETPLTPEKRFSGSGGTDPGLSDVGRHQAERVAAALAARGTIQAIVTSPLRRCRETAEAVARRLGLDVRVEEGLRETDFGAWEGLTFAEVKERHPDDLEAWLASSKVAPTGGGESFAAVTRRVALSRDKLIARYTGRTVLLVTHVTPIKTLVRLALGAPPETLFRMELSAASLSAVAYYTDGNASLRLLNETAHLR